MAEQPIKELHTLIGRILLPRGPKGTTSPAFNVGVQLFETMHVLADVKAADRPDLLDKLTDEMLLARTVNLIDEVTLTEACKYIEQAKQTSGVE